ncbi:5-formyltetrahydrofolate cyclo-ligase [Mangrovitalea sediminis]|uniref:5-formyltetrahydrofolate cyclo-ligase n=1 Tax=Mangrovitalea sediminis TaxID=1982043 RepID=UPI000BE55A9E|nr:5-formyltetrahydrofolate cyclo-ligase [Mangrovitalea sediminis]
MPSNSAIDATLQDQRQQLRRKIRRQRRALTPDAQKKASLLLIRHLLSLPALKRARRLAIYLPNDGEIDPTAFIQVARQLGKTCYLPVLHPILHNRLWFYRFDSHTRLRHNRFGIPEPAHRNAPRCAPWALHVVLLPLVAFDADGGRLGMGGGFYDRTFGFTRHSAQPAPRLVGLAHELQRVDRLPIADWDVPLEAIVTDRAIYGSRNATAMQGAGEPRILAGRHRLKSRLKRACSTRTFRILQQRIAPA